MRKVANPGPGKRRGRPSGTLTAKQAIFIAEYLKDMNGAKAAAAAGYSHPSVAAAKLLNPDLYPHVVEAVEEGLAQKREECAIEARRIVKELAYIAFLDLARLVGEDGRLIDLRDLPEGVRRAVKEMEVEEPRDPDGPDADRRVVPAAMYDKLAALRLLAALLGYLRAKPQAPQTRIPTHLLAMTDAERREAILRLLRPTGGAQELDAADEGNAHRGPVSDDVVPRCAQPPQGPPKSGA
jgi:phage terminase small subunit